MAYVLCISGMADIPGCSHRRHSRGVGVPGPRSAGIVQGCDVREVREPGLLGTCVSKPDLVTFLEQRKDSRNIRRVETTPIHPGMSEWMEPMTAASSLHTQCVMPRNPGFEDLCPIENL